MEKQDLKILTPLLYMKMMILIRKKRGKLFMENKHYVYILQCKDDTLYTGYTNDLENRLEKHENGKGQNILEDVVLSIVVYRGI